MRVNCMQNITKYYILLRNALKLRRFAGGGGDLENHQWIKNYKLNEIRALKVMDTKLTILAVFSILDYTCTFFI
jgi:hypothetical protein